VSRFAAALPALVFVLGGCTSTDTELRVFVAASLVDVAREWQDDAAAQNIGFAIHSGGSIMLARQVATGARADFLLTAGTPVIDVLGDVVPLAVDSALLTNHLVIVTRRGIAPPATLADLADSRFERIAMADPVLAPAGIYAAAAIEQAGIAEAIASRLIQTGDVRMALASVATGSADAAFVYATDAATEPELATLNVEAAAVTYSLIMLPPEKPANKALWDYLHSAPARAIARKYGFGA
jgi:molybdate transport system substrate-binding protein